MDEEMKRIWPYFWGPIPTHCISHAASPINLVGLTTTPTAAHPISQIFSLDYRKLLIYKDNFADIVIIGVSSS